MKSRWISGALVALPLLLTAHPTPVVTLLEHADAIRQSLHDAQRFYLRTVTVGQRDLATIRKSVDYQADDDKVQFYIGKRSDGTTAGTVLFPQVNTMHGPVEVALTLTPDGHIARVAVTRATVETRPWVEEAVQTGVLEKMQGLSATDDPMTVVAPLKGRIGAMPWFEAQIIAAAVKQGMVVYAVLYGGT